MTRLAISKPERLVELYIEGVLSTQNFPDITTPDETQSTVLNEIYQSVEDKIPVKIRECLKRQFNYNSIPAHQIYLSLDHLDVIELTQVQKNMLYNRISDIDIQMRVSIINELSKSPFGQSFSGNGFGDTSHPRPVFPPFSPYCPPPGTNPPFFNPYHPMNAGAIEARLIHITSFLSRNEPLEVQYINIDNVRQRLLNIQSKGIMAPYPSYLDDFKSYIEKLDKILNQIYSPPQSTETPTDTI